MDNIEEKKLSLSFAAIDAKVVENIPHFEEIERGGKQFIYYGGDNCYPEYLYGLYNDVSTLKTIIEGTSDFVAGNAVHTNFGKFEKEVNKKGDTLQDLLKWCSRDWLIYGGYCLQVIRNLKGDISEIYYLDFRYVRSDKYNECFWYSEDFCKRYLRQDKTIIYPRFIEENRNIPTSVIYVKNTRTGTYPIPRYSGAVKACEIERNVDNMHLNGIENGFMGSYLISFLNGIPSDTQKAEIEKNIVSKFCGSGNSGRVVINYANSKDNAVQLDKLDITDFGEKYKSAADRSREQIFVAFGASPQIFGLTSESTGFNQQEYSEAFKLYNRCAVRPIQQKLCKTFDRIFGMDDSITIEPFSLETNIEKNVE